VEFAPSFPGGVPIALAVGSPHGFILFVPPLFLAASLLFANDLDRFCDEQNPNREQHPSTPDEMCDEPKDGTDGEKTPNQPSDKAVDALACSSPDTKPN
jgi:hypothetical protein